MQIVHQMPVCGAGRRRRRWALLYLLAIAAIFATPAALAQQDRLDAALAETIARPTDPEAAFDYARLAAAAGQTRAAIAALERVLRINPGLDNIRLELASLYLAAGSPDVATVYAQQALQSPNIPPEVADRARGLLKKAEGAASRHLLQANIFTGARWDSNATQATALTAVPLFDPLVGNTVTVNPSLRAQSAWSWVTSAQLTHNYDLGLQQEGSWETNLSVFDQRFFHINHAFDLDAIQIDSGPRLGIGELAGAALSARPFGTAGYLAYGDRPYATLYGGGVTGQAQLSAALSVNVTVSGRFGGYYDTTFRPRSRDYTGAEWSLAVGTVYAVAPGITLSADASYYWAGARQDFYAREGPAVSATATAQLPIDNYALGVSGHVGYRHLGYVGADPFIDPTHRRSDDILDAGLSLLAPVNERVKLVAQYSYYRQLSNYQLYSFDNNSVSLGVRVDF
jgi:tetratricopeptide (TPR) repeat protein